MPIVPRILRYALRPGAEVHTFDEPRPVIAGLRWVGATPNGGRQWRAPREWGAMALARTADGVLVRWEDQGGSHTDWLEASDVRFLDV